MEKDSLIPSVRVILWSAPRCLSSAFERSVRELKTVKVLYEPHQQAYYYGPERATESNVNYSTYSVMDPTATFEAADDKLLQPYHGYEALFTKNHAYFIKGNYRQYTEGRFSTFKHTLLIRNPCKSIPSLVRARKRCGFPSNPHENGFEQLHDLYRTVQCFSDPNPIVIDADDLLINPRFIMNEYCSAVGLPFDEGMLTWTPGVVQDWTGLPYYREWHETAMMSSGFVKPNSTNETSVIQEDDLPRNVEDAVKKALAFHDVMHASRIKPGCDV